MAASFLEVHKDFAENIVVGFARLAGRSIGIIANQPAFLAGVLDINSSTKGAHVLYVFAIALIYHYWYLKMCRGFCRAPTRNGMLL
jgi:acetyl-CoA carboxylase carboxyltransferase component